MRMNSIIKLCDYFFILRPTLFFPVWTVYAAGYFAFHRFTPGGVNGATTAVASDSCALLGFLTMIMGSAYILNQLCDVETDARNHKLFLIAQRHVTPLAAWSEMILLLGAGVAAAFFYGAEIGVLFFIIFLVTGLLYNVSPFEWKGRPLWGVFANAAGAWLIFTAGWWSVKIELTATWLYATPYALAVAAVYLYTTLLDLEGDAEARKFTFGVKYGWRATVFTGCLFELAAAASAYYLDDPVIFYPALVSAPFFLLAAIKQRHGDVARAIKLPILFLALAICFEVWQYLLVLAFVFFFSKWYYRRRFGLSYPNLRAQ